MLNPEISPAAAAATTSSSSIKAEEDDESAGLGLGEAVEEGVWRFLLEPEARTGGVVTPEVFLGPGLGEGLMGMSGRVGDTPYWA